MDIQRKDPPEATKNFAGVMESSHLVISLCSLSNVMPSPSRENEEAEGSWTLSCGLANTRGISEKLLEKHPTLMTEVDDFGRSALHYAALHRSNEVAEELLMANKSIACVVAGKDKNKTALHIATCEGNEMVTGDGQNILHLSVKFKQEEAFKFIMKKSWVGNLINQKDAEGNTPLHAYAATPDFYSCALTGEDNLLSILLRCERSALLLSSYHNNVPSRTSEFSKISDALNEMTEDKYLLFLHVLMENEDTRSQGAVMKELKANGAKLVASNAMILENSLLLMMKKHCPKNKRTVPTDIRKIGDTHMVVAALIITVAFATEFTIPGGYDGNDGPNKGLVTLSRKATFKAFIITDTLAMACSASAVFLHFFAAAEIDKRKLMNPYLATAMLVMVAMGVMVIAFMTGLYAVLEHSRELAIIECVICSFCFLVFYYPMKRAFRSHDVLNLLVAFVKMLIVSVNFQLNDKLPWNLLGCSLCYEYKLFLKKEEKDRNE
ncbi:protein ACCELERATED CELL DEATH 6-like [Olea europaea var. sylvestris]|uniref:protein ACCELERATED CELL DEATH 6-like n=1 Tax=Olea europaea var. sylvestris TaxID=158386 RepID=UPI000C1D119D|nr:protein ACCELERATED CELL DEATH 6-like [Olea europaea var. sylvestris]